MSSSAAATPWKRMIAAFIDSIIASIPAYIILILFSIANVNLGIIGYCLVWLLIFGLRDALPIPSLNGASIGKKVFGLQALRSDGSPCDYEASFKRNGPLMIGMAFYLLSGLLGLIRIPVLPFILVVLGGIAGLLMIVIELYKIFTDDRGLRIGDLFASTYVEEQGGGAFEQMAPHPPPPPPGEDASSGKDAPPPPPPA